jgi:hypothetical protein
VPGGNVAFYFPPTVQAKVVPGGCLVMPAIVFCIIIFLMLSNSWAICEANMVSKLALEFDKIDKEEQE